jgi:GT2 family glycosyltransferase
MIDSFSSMTNDPYRTEPLIQCVIVLYKQRPSEARSLSSLSEICALDPSIAERIRVLVQDNSPESQASLFEAASLGFEYHHAAENPGLADAYNRALEMATDRKAAWLLLLDQDTVLKRGFLLQLLAAVQSEASDEACAFVPELVKDGSVFSPQVLPRRSFRPLPLGFSGFAADTLDPVNSAACLKVQALSAIGGFPREYWLDFLDVIVFHRLQAAGGRIYVLDSQLEHSLSLLNLEAEMSVARYSNMLAAEWRFIRETGSRGGALIHRLRLLKLSLHRALKLKNKEYARETLRAAMR